MTGVNCSISGQQILSLDVGQAEERYGLDSAQVENPEEAFERHWALAVVEKVFESLRAESNACGRGRLFAQLKGAIAGEKGDPTYAETARMLGLTEKEVKKASNGPKSTFSRGEACDVKEVPLLPTGRLIT